MKKLTLLGSIFLTGLFVSFSNNDNDLFPQQQVLAESTHETVQTDAVKAVFTIDNAKSLVPEFGQVNLTNLSQHAVSYSWDFGNGDISTDHIPSYKYKMHGFYTITLTCIDDKGNESKTSHDIEVLCTMGGSHSSSN